MNEEFNYYDKAPRNYGACFKEGCASADNCLRALVGRDVSRSAQKLMVVNPHLANAAGEADCSFYVSGERIRIAFGFENALNLVPLGKAKEARNALIKLFTKRIYYKLLGGEVPINTKRQAQIASVLNSYGATLPIEFDRYEMCGKWR